MSAPVPAPRTLYLSESKKPVPKPRTSVPIVRQKSNESSGSSKASEENSSTNTFSRRVRNLSNASKQIAGDIGELVHDRKRAVIEGTRQSVRKITKRFTSNSPELNLNDISKSEENKDDELVDVFNSIRFQSPVESIYSNISLESESRSELNFSDDSQNLPPPSYPPPPLRQESVYDAPQPVASSNTDSSGQSPILSHKTEIYESVFPSYTSSSDGGSYKNMNLTVGAPEQKADLSRSDSWSFYDPVPRPESVYGNVDNTPILKPIVTSEISSINEGDELSVSHSNISQFERQNSLYENYNPPNTTIKPTRPSTSIILQFDPLTNNNSTTLYVNVNIEDEKKLLEELLQGELQAGISNIESYDNWSLSNESEADEYLQPPPPPARFDSLPDELPQVPPKTKPEVKQEKSRTSWFTESNSNVRPSSAVVSESRKTNWLMKHMNDVIKKAPEVVKNIRSRDNMLVRPSLGPKSTIQHKGMLYKVQSGPVEDLFGEFSGRWCVLENSNFICYGDNTCDNIKEHFPMENILSVQILLDQKYRYRFENDNLHCFELNVSGKSRGGYVYGSRSISERRVWMQRIAESLTYRFSAKITSDYIRIGWAYIREGVSGTWVGAWVVLSQRTLYYAVDHNPVKSMDLRKARCIVLYPVSETDNNPFTNDKAGPNILIDSQCGALYLRMWTSRETKVWCHIVKLAAHNNGANLDQQQLTKNDVPVIVEKSINFIYARGSMSEGIYRKAGGGAIVNELLARFRKDAWDVQLTSAKYSEHDVATALKRFFRDLPEPLLPNSRRKYLQQVSLLNNRDEKIRMYKATFDQLPATSFKTAQMLFGHLSFINSQSSKNRMHADNLAAVWGPTLMHYEERDGEKNLNPEKSGVVVCQIINMYRDIFPGDPAQLEQERRMLQVLERCLKSPQGAVHSKVTGDFRVWVYLYNKDGETYNIALGPQKTAYEVCVELSSKMKIEVHELILEEYILDGKLIRPIHHSEKVLDVVLRWGYWDEIDRKDNYLVLSNLSKYWEYIQDKALPVSGELKFADTKMKNLKSFVFEFSQSKLSYYKDKTCSTKLGSWNIEDIMWYLGNETKRNPPFKWTITFIETNSHPKRTKQSPFFGNILMWSDPTLRATWLAAMLKARYPKGIIPPPQHVNLMSN